MQILNHLPILTLICQNWSLVKRSIVLYIIALFCKIVAFAQELLNRVIRFKLKFNDQLNHSFQQKFKSFYSPLDKGYKKLSDIININLPPKFPKFNDRIQNLKDIPSPSRPKLIQLDSNSVHQLSKDEYKNDKNFLSMSTMQQFFQTTPLTVFRLSINYVGTLETRSSRNINQRQRTGQLRRQRYLNRLYRRHRRNASASNEDTINRIVNLPPQISNDPLIHQFFNGFSFI